MSEAQNGVYLPTTALALNAGWDEALLRSSWRITVSTSG
jgi:hypothetical protein